MYARVSTIDGTPEGIDAAVEYLNAGGDFRQAPGFKGNYLLVDRSSGKLLTITLWDSLANLENTAQQVNPIRQEGARRAGATKPPVVTVYEVAIHP